MFTSSFLATKIAQLHNGLITELEFLLALQATPETTAALQEFDAQVPPFPVPVDYPAINLDLFQSWRAANKKPRR